jgi:hypothetical protein
MDIGGLKTSIKKHQSSYQEKYQYVRSLMGFVPETAQMIANCDQMETFGKYGGMNEESKCS